MHVTLEGQSIEPQTSQTCSFGIWKFSSFFFTSAYLLFVIVIILLFIDTTFAAIISTTTLYSWSN